MTAPTMVQQTFPHVARKTFQGDAASVAEVRVFLAQALAGTGFDVEDAVLAVDELAANAVLYSRSRNDKFDVWAGWSASILQVLVVDEGPLPETERPVELERCGGQGLRIVKTLTSDYGSYDDPNGCHVAWFRLTLPADPKGA
ncbi:ATP-binding protein [Actinoallomurus sp. CA-150999]|uniref:ATP-binding protein n=1 Tax=Actinoallomurus sp. CA-150999 TaxID=3239887 RepID=UPI003D8F9989